MHPSEASNYYNTQKSDGDFTPIVEGDVIDLGERPLEIIAHYCGGVHMSSKLSGCDALTRN